MRTRILDQRMTWLCDVVQRCGRSNDQHNFMLSVDLPHMDTYSGILRVNQKSQPMTFFIENWDFGRLEALIINHLPENISRR